MCLTKKNASMFFNRTDTQLFCHVVLKPCTFTFPRRLKSSYSINARLTKVYLCINCQRSRHGWDIDDVGRRNSAQCLWLVDTCARTFKQEQQPITDITQTYVGLRPWNGIFWAETQENRREPHQGIVTPSLSNLEIIKLKKNVTANVVLIVLKFFPTNSHDFQVCQH